MISDPSSKRKSHKPPTPLVDDANFRDAVLEAKDYADRGDFIEEDEMDMRFEEMLRS